MEGETPATAPAPASEAVSTNTNLNVNAPAPAEAAPAPAVTAEQVAQFFGTTPAMAVKMQSFYSANGGVEKVEDRFAQVKQAVSNPQPQAQPQAAQTQAPVQPQTQVAQPAQAPQPMPGTITQQDMVVKMYFDNVANQPQYANIADEIRSGEIFNQMKAMGSSPFELDGSLNAGRLNAFLDMYSKTKPAVTPTPVTNAANAAATNYTPMENGGITSREQALKIFMEAGNPNHQAAVDWLRQDRRNILKGK